MAKDVVFMQAVQDVSIARFGPDSSVYVYHANGHSYLCFGCSLAKHVGSSLLCTSAREMASHLTEHAKAGHRVPLHALEVLAYEIDHGFLSWLDRPQQGDTSCNR